MLYIYDKYLTIIVSKSTSEVTVKPLDWCNWGKGKKPKRHLFYICSMSVH